jgi:hypothetical protein
VGWGDAGMSSGAMQVELLFESSVPIWNRKWNLPHNLKSQFTSAATHLRGSGGLGCPEEISLLCGTCYKIPKHQGRG